MLEGVAVELCVVVEIVGICKEVVACAEHITTADIRTRQSYLLWTGNLEAVFGTAIEGFAYLVSEIGIGILVTNDLHGIVHACGAMVGGEHYLIAECSNSAEHLRRRRVLKPTEGEAAVGCLVVGQFAHHFAIGA